MGRVRAYFYAGKNNPKKSVKVMMWKKEMLEGVTVIKQHCSIARRQLPLPVHSPFSSLHS